MKFSKIRQSSGKWLPRNLSSLKFMICPVKVSFIPMPFRVSLTDECIHVVIRTHRPWPHPVIITFHTCRQINQYSIQNMHITKFIHCICSESSQYLLLQTEHIFARSSDADISTPSFAFPPSLRSKCSNRYCENHRSIGCRKVVARTVPIIENIWFHAITMPIRRENGEKYLANLPCLL